MCLCFQWYFKYLASVYMRLLFLSFQGSSSFFISSLSQQWATIQLSLIIFCMFYKMSMYMYFEEDCIVLHISVFLFSLFFYWILRFKSYAYCFGTPSLLLIIAPMCVSTTFLPIYSVSDEHPCYLQLTHLLSKAAVNMHLYASFKEFWNNSFGILRRRILEASLLKYELYHLHSQD